MKRRKIPTDNSLKIGILIFNHGTDMDDRLKDVVQRLPDSPGRLQILQRKMF